ncbi:L,D-transpeptidase family protein [Amaricoccus sp.]|uniref:L,D-transpeptidase family protein n=1 Tax=Amaricoccus sp. TaxID=1872485 RepID=UPI001B5C1620|nr:L,D-transpeptidase family protein [Amaricoccus sp.]MBP7240430.1 L,D-transpeptidase family protein [Amaricoccus sp.]
MAPRFGRRGLLGLAAGAACLGTPAIARAFALPVAPRADHIVVSKSKRVLELRAKGEILKRYRIALGFTPEGHKTASGDGRTPEGLYWIDRRNPRSEYFLSIGISYPNAEDEARARSLGVRPGGDIFIHGQPVRPREIRAAQGKKDWTAGCIAVANDEIEEIWAMTPLATPITILA